MKEEKPSTYETQYILLDDEMRVGKWWRLSLDVRKPSLSYQNIKDHPMPLVFFYKIFIIQISKTVKIKKKKHKLTKKNIN